MDEALQLVIEMNEWTWNHFKNDLADATSDEINWRPLPQANNINAILRHLRIEAQWHLASLEGRDAAAQPQFDPQPLDFEHNLKELEESYTRFIAALHRMTLAALQQQTASAYRDFPGEASTHLLGFHQAVHLATHWGQIRTIRNLYRKARGEPARFFPENPTFPPLR
jgi:hypothetical protein